MDCLKSQTASHNTVLVLMTIQETTEVSELNMLTHNLKADQTMGDNDIVGSGLTGDLPTTLNGTEWNWMELDGTGWN